MNNASIFIIEKTGNNYKDFDEFPNKLYVDTSAWIYAFGSENNAYHARLISEFMGDCSTNSVKLYHSGLVLSEAIHVNRNAEMDKVIDENNIRIPRFNDGNVDYKKLNQLINQQYPNIEQKIDESNRKLISFIRESSMMLEYIDDDESFDEMIKIQQSSGNILGTHDAKHVYIARSYRINSFLTADGDFTSLDNDNIFVTPNEKYVKEKWGRNNIILPFNENQY